MITKKIFLLPSDNSQRQENNNFNLHRKVLIIQQWIASILAINPNFDAEEYYTFCGPRVLLNSKYI